MVYEARAGQTFLLGASTWRIEEIGRDRVIVSPAPGAPGAVPFWRGDGVGRPKELGKAIGAFSRWAVGQDAETLEADYDLDPLAASNLLAFLREQEDATRVVPSDRTIVVERFRDEIGDWRLCVLSPYGGRVHAAWGLALSRRIREQYGLESDAIWSDDGIIVHLPDADEPPGAELVMLEPDEIEDAVVAELASSALFGARFRENAGRALLIPRAYPGKRTPLWQQRLKSQSLLEVAKRYPDFPIILETYRECLRDVLDVPGLIELAARPARARAVARRGRDADRVAVRLVAALRLRRDVHVRGRRAERRAPRRRAVAGPRPAARAARPGGAARAHRPRTRWSRSRPTCSTAPTARAPRRATRSPTSCAASATSRPRRCASASSRRRRPTRCSTRWPPSAARCALRIGGEPRWVAADDAGLYRDALGTVPPGGLPDAFTADVPDALAKLVARYARTHGPFTTGRAARALRASIPTAVLERLERDGELVRGELRPGGRPGEPEWCDTEVLRRLRRASLAALRKEIEPADQRALAAFLPSWQGVDRHPAAGAGHRPPARGARPAAGARAARRGVGARRAAAPHAARTRRRGWTSSARRARSCGSAPGSLGRSTGRVALYFRDDAEAIGRPSTPRGAAAEPPAEPEHDLLRERLAQSPCFFTDLLAEIALSPEQVQEALWDLVWAGEVTNDAFAPLRAPRLTLARAQKAPRHGATPALRRAARRRASRRSRAAGR